MSGKEMPTTARRYAYGVIATGGFAFAAAIWNWASPNPQHFVIYFALSLIASMLKFRLPGITGTYSPSFLLTLVGVIEFTFPETLVASSAGALVQSMWKSKQRDVLQEAARESDRLLTDAQTATNSV